MSNEYARSTEERVRKERENAVQPEPFLNEAGAIQATGDERKLAFTESFAKKLAASLDSVRASGVGVSELARLFGVPESEVLKKDREYTSWRIRKVVYNWPSEGALLFDIATDRALREVTDDWADVPPKQRFLIAQSLRSFQDECLFCGGAISITNTPVQSCCRNAEVMSMHCTGCERRFIEFRIEDDEGVSVGQ